MAIFSDTPRRLYPFADKAFMRTETNIVNVYADSKE